ncbi:MAG: hypothetical protein U0271_14235 [Polyangiaceae bacterium]
MQTSAWQVLEPSLPLLAADYGGGRARMVALGLEGGGLVVWSPGVPERQGNALEDLRNFGEPRFLLAPNHFHNLGIPHWTRSFPSARVVASERARTRLSKKLPGIVIDGLEGLSRALPPGTRLLCPPNAKQGETWLAVERDTLRALVVCDAIVNMQHVSIPFKILGFRARLMLNPFFKRFFMGDRAAHRAWMLAELGAHPPNLLIPAHGEMLQGARVADDLRRVVETLPAR